MSIKNWEREMKTIEFILYYMLLHSINLTLIKLNCLYKDIISYTINPNLQFFNTVNYIRYHLYLYFSLVD